MPKVTLLGASSRRIYHYFYGREYKFFYGVAQEVPVMVALELKKKVTRKGKPLFAVEAFDTPAPPAPLPETYKLPEQNSYPRQLRFGQWL